MKLKQFIENTAKCCWMLYILGKRKSLICFSVVVVWLDSKSTHLIMITTIMLGDYNSFTPDFIAPLTDSWLVFCRLVGWIVGACVWLLSRWFFFSVTYFSSTFTSSRHCRRVFIAALEFFCTWTERLSLVTNIFACFTQRTWIHAFFSLILHCMETGVNGEGGYPINLSPGTVREQLRDLRESTLIPLFIAILSYSVFTL